MRDDNGIGQPPRALIAHGSGQTSDCCMFSAIGAAMMLLELKSRDPNDRERGGINWWKGAETDSNHCDIFPIIKNILLLSLAGYTG